MNKQMAINGVVEPDFLEYVEETFSKWNKLFEDGITLGTREITKFESAVNGGKLNSRFGFFSISHRGWNEETQQNHYTITIYKNIKASTSEKPLFVFDTPIHE